MAGRESISKYVLLASLYFTQFLPFAFFITALPVIMRREGYSLEQIGYLYALGIPYALKFLWAPYIDRGAGKANHYKKIVFLLTSLYVLVTLAASTFLPGENMPLLFVLLFVGLFFLSTQDIAVDAIATRILKSHERGVGNGLQAAGAFVGYFVGGGIMLMNYNRIGWQNTIYIMSGLLVLSLIPLFFYHEPALPVKSRASFKTLYTFFQRKKIIAPFLLAIFTGLPLQMAYHKFRPFMTDAGFSNEQIGFYIGLVGMASAIVFSLVTGYLIKLFGIRKSLMGLLFLTLSAFPFLIFPTLGYQTSAFLWAAVLFGGGFSGSVHAVCYSLYMDHARPGSEGSDFTLQNAAAFLVGSLFMPLSGALADRVGYTSLYTVAMFAQVLLIFAGGLYFWRSRVKVPLAETLKKPDIQTAEAEVNS